MPTETFRIIIRTEGGRKSRQVFEDVTTAANATGRAVNRTVNVIVNGAGRAERGVRRVRREMNALSRSTIPLASRIGAMMRSFVVPGAAATSLRNWGRAARGLAGAFAGMYVGRQLMEATDAGTRLTNTLRGFGATESALKAVRQRIFEISNEARVSANETGTLYGRLQLATSNLGLVQEEVLGMTKTMAQALQLSGSSGLEASQSIRQLSQAFNKGKLDGDEFRSVLENAPIITKLLTDELQISKSMLYDWAASGKITVNTLVRAFRNGEKSINADFQRLERTIGSALIQMYNDFISFMVAFDERTDISKKMISGIDLIRNHFDELAKTLRVVLGYYVAMGAASYASKMITAAEAATAAATAAAAVQARSSSLVGVSGYLAATGAMMARPDRVLSQSSKGVKDVLLGLTGVRTVIAVIARGFAALASPLKLVLGLVRSLLTPWRLLQVAVVGVAAGISGGFLDALSHALGTTGRIETAFRFIKLSVRAIAHQITAAFRAVGRFLSEMFDSIVNSIKATADFLYALVAAMANTAPAIANNLGNLVKKSIDPLGLLFDDGDYKQSVGNIADTFRSEFQRLKSEKLGSQMMEEATQSLIETVSGIGGLVSESVSGFLAPEDRVMRYEDAFENLRQKVLETKAVIEKVQQLDLKRLGYENEEAMLQVDGLLQQIGNIQTKFDPSMNEQIAEQMRAGGDNAAKLMNSVESFTLFLSRSATVLSEIEAMARASIGAQDDVRQSLDALNQSALADGVSPQAKLAAEQMAAEVNSVLVNKAYEIGNNVFAAFMSGFGGAVGDIARELGQRVSPMIGGGSAGGGETMSRAFELVGDATTWAKDNLTSYRDELGALNSKMQEFQTSGMKAMESVGKSAQGTASQMERFFQQTFGNLEDALVNFVTTGEFDFKKFINAVIADLARLFIRMLIIQPMMNMMGFGMMGFRSGGLVQKVPQYATGGLIGGVGSSTSDRYLAAVSPGEFMMNAAATRRNYPDLVRMNNGGEPRRSKGAHSSQTINFSPQVTVVNEGSGSEGSGPEQGEQIATLIRQSFVEMIAREQRQGGLLASTAPRGFV